MGDRCADERPKGDVVAVVVDRLAQGLKGEELVHVEDEARGVADEEELERQACNTVNIFCWVFLLPAR